jgi:sugar lactone lactonase YvrE
MKNTIYSLLALPLALISFCAAAKDLPAKQSTAVFVENKGQIVDQNNVRRTDIDYKMTATNGLTVFLGAGGIHYQFSKPADGEPASSKLRKTYPQEMKPTTYSMYRMDVELVNANKDAHVSTGVEQQYTERYFLPESDNDGTTVHSYNTITYTNVYPHIDWIVKTKNGKLKHEFVVHKGGNPGDIKIKYAGASGLSLNAFGALVAKTPQGDITETAPYSYQSNKKEIKSSFKLDGNIIGYETGSFDGDLIIDPDLTWATYYGGSASDFSFSNAVDGSGNVYLAGFTESTNNIVTAGAFNVTYVGYFLAYLAKFNKDGVRQWGTYYGGTGYEQGLAVATDISGNVYLTGKTASSSGIATTGAFDVTLGGGYDAFLVKFNSNGGRVWGSYIGGSGDDYGNAVTTDAAGNVYVGGNTESNSGIATAGVFKTTYSSGDAFIVKFNASGVRQWGSYFGSATTVEAILVETSGNIYFAGHTSSSTGIASAGAHQTALASAYDYDAYLAKFNSSGARLWSTYYGGEGSDESKALALDGSGNIYMTGTTNSFVNIATSGAYQTSLFASLPYPNSDIFLAKFNSSGVRQWGTYYGKDGNETAAGIGIDATGTIYVGGKTESDTALATADSIKVGNRGGFAAKFSSAGMRTWGTFCPGDSWMNMVTDAQGNMYFSGTFYSATDDLNFSTTQSHQENVAGDNDAFLYKISNGISQIGGSNSQLCIGSSITLTNTVSGGTWTSDDPAVAVIDPSSGAITGINLGYTSVTYTLPSGLFSTRRIYSGYAQINTIAGTGTAGNTGDGGQALTATLYSPNTVKVDASGNTYVVSDNKIRKINTSGVITTICGTGVAGYSGDGGAATLAKINGVSGIDFDAAGNMYLADAENHRIRKISTAGTITTIAGNGTAGTTGDGGAATTASLYYPIGVTVDAAGNIYVCQGRYGTDYRVRKINTSGVITTIAGTGSYGFSGDGGPATAAELYQPYSVAINSLNELLIVDRQNNRIRKVDAAGIITTFAGNGYSDLGDGGPAFDASFYYPTAIAIDPFKNTYIADNFNNRIRKIDSFGIITTYAGTGDAGDNGDNGPAILSKLNCVGLCTDAGGNVYFADPGANKIKKIHSCGVPSIAPVTGTRNICVGSTAIFSNDTAGGTWSSSNTAVATIDATSGFVTGIGTGSAIITYTVSGNYALSKLYVGMSALSNVTAALTAANDGDGGPATAAHVAYPTGIAKDASGNIYFVSNGTIRKIDPSGIITTVAGTDGIGGYIGDGGLATAAYLYNPTGIAVDAAGNIYIADRQNNRIRKINTSGVISTLLGNGSYSESGDGGLAIFATCAYPSGIAVDAAGNIYFTDQGASRVRKINTAGVVTTVAGIGVYGFSGDGGPATAAALNQPFGLHIDAAGNLIIADRTNSRIRKVNASGIISTIAGNGENGFSGDGSAATAATLHFPIGVTTDATGNLYIADASNYRVRKVSVGGTISTIAGNGVYGYSGIGGTPTEAELPSCWGVVVDAAGDIYVTEYEANAVVKITPCNNVSEFEPITGTATACIGATTTLNCTTTGGTWTSGSPTIATVDAAGVVTGIMAGTADISYTTGTIVRTKTVTINALPEAITGTLSACVGTTTALGDATSGGTWSSGAVGIATVVSATGVITGVAAGTATISYTAATSCYVTAVATINSNPLAITGSPMAICAGGTTTLTCTTTGGTWSSSATGVGTVGSTTGVVTGIAAGITSISYTLGTGCSSTATVTVNPNPATITGTMSVCVAATTTLATTTTGGAWISTSTSTATIGVSTGIVTGVAAGTTTVSYAISATGCYTTAVVSVNPLPAAITGTLTVCDGHTTTLSSTTTGATWSSGTAAVATIGTSGDVTGLSAGTSIISYTTSSGCRATAIVTVNPVPLAITGTATVCQGATATLADASSGGTWISSSTIIATIGSASGTVGGVTAGTATMSYVLTATGCYATVIATVNPLPAAITGALTVCTGSVTSLSDVTSGGSWSSSATTIAIVGATSGIVSGLTAGTVNISYTLPTGCKVQSTVTVNLTPSAITGTAIACEGATTTLSSAPAGGTWSSGTTTVGTVTSAGIVSALSAGTSTIMYMLSTGCNATKVYTVNPLPAAITGTMSVCAGSTTTLADATSGGTWTSGTPASATIAPSTGIVSGILTGTTNITYTLGTGCYRSAIVTVNPLPASITGTASVCQGATTTLSDVTTGGTWSSGTTSVATIGSSTGIVAGISAGTSLISFTLGTGCLSSIVVSVNPLPDAIAGTTSVCLGATTTLSSATPGGTWGSSTSGIVSVSSAGVANGIAFGTATITYTLPTGCFDTIVVTTDTVPSFTVGGVDYICIGTPATFTSSITGGTWLSGNTSLATVSASGVVSGVASGTVDISYSFTNSCGTTSNAKNIHVYTVAQCDSLTDTKIIKSAPLPVELFPNPNMGQFSVIVHSEMQEKLSITIYNQLGQIVWEGAAVSNSIININTNLAPGIYTLVAQNQFRNDVIKFVNMREL